MLSRRTPGSLLLAAVLIIPAWPIASQGAEPKFPPGQWVALFNGRDLSGWAPKIRGYALGENYGRTFRVEDGLLKVAYDQYGQFDSRFGHLFYQYTFSHYRLRVEYRFVGQQVAGGPGWAVRNSGIMLHCQDPATMARDQEFPVSIEAQMLGGDGMHDRTTGNVCTPGTHIVIDGNLVTRHCTSSQSATFHGDQWVSLEVVVRGDTSVRHLVNGQEVIEYQQPQLDETDPHAQPLIRDGQKQLREGFISLQAESHPIEFRKVEIMVLE